MPDERPHERRELMAPYEHPYRYALRSPDLRVATALAAALWLSGVVILAAGEPGLGLGACLGALLGTIAIALSLLVTGWRMKQSWAPATELCEVRARRPHGGSEDPDVVHDEFAVTVEDDGQLVTWRFRPLAIGEAAAAARLSAGPGWPAPRLADRPCRGLADRA
jgi:hypothetical protein